MKYIQIDNKLHINNRKRFFQKMKPNSIAIFPANPVVAENGDAVYRYKANSNVVWLSGITQEKTMVILYPDNPDKNSREVLVVQRPNEHLEKWNGHLLRKHEATDISGIQNVQYKTLQYFKELYCGLRPLPLRRSRRLRRTEATDLL